MRKDRYFFTVNILLLVIIFIGFAPSFFLRPINYEEPLPGYLTIHGIASTLWFVIIVLQSFWAQTKRIHLHRKLGVIFSYLTPIITFSGLWVVYHRIQTYFDQTVEKTPESIAFQLKESMLIWGDILLLVSFGVLAWLGYRNRHRFPFHKRYMLVSSVMLAPPALVRIGKFEFLQIGNNPGLSGSLYSVAIPILLLLSLLVYDRYRLKKMHPVSIGGLGWYILLLVIATLLMKTGIGAEILEVIR
ncbi:MAG: hypothetical protein KDD63_03935 [Bacteroidetes bacterium]|nr:hypothetical protein [Bacteroidota bacterium]